MNSRRITTKYSDQIMLWLAELNYTHSFFLGGGNCMHLIDSASKFFKTIPVVHEISAGIAAEYFTDLANNNEKAFSIVTAGPGITNSVSAVAGAWLESRPMLLIAGQAKTNNLSINGARQIGHQEINAVALMKPITKKSIQVSHRISKNEFQEIVLEQFRGRPGPVFIEFCLDITSMPVLENINSEFENLELNHKKKLEKLDINKLERIIHLMNNSKRPLFLFGGGLDRKIVNESISKLEELGLPIAVTWNGADRVNSEYKYYCGRPNTYGMRYSNIIVQNCDLLITFGTRLGIQQVGFAWEEFAPMAKVVQIEIDEAELNKGFPKVDLPIQGDANLYLKTIVNKLNKTDLSDLNYWHKYINKVRNYLPTVENNYKPKHNYVEPYQFIKKLNDLSKHSDIWVSCSSGGTFTAFMQVIEPKKLQKIISSKGLASMGFGLAGAIGAAFANPNSRILLTEGDGGFAQNLQELGTVQLNNLNIKIFIFANNGYASIRTSQKSYFQGNYLGCDLETGLMLPDWVQIAKSYNLNYEVINSDNFQNKTFIPKLNDTKPCLFIVNVDPDQPYLPKITSRILEDGSMISNPLNKMYPYLDDTIELELRLPQN